jgi:GNAT superfamily N-acetyltransferase
MPDLLVKLYELPDASDCLRSLREQDTLVRPAMAYEKSRVVDWVRAAFGDAWASECDVAFGNRPIACFIATVEGSIAGFACYDSTCRGFFGPVGVAADRRGRGIGKALLLACLDTMRTLGYGYAIVGGAGDVEFYRRAVGATPIEGSSPGIYRDRLAR